MVGYYLLLLTQVLCTIGTSVLRRQSQAQDGLTLICRQTLPKLYVAGEYNVNSDNTSNANYAILDQMDSFRGYDGFFHFVLRWPGDVIEYEWRQSSNPLTENIEGYEGIHIPYEGQHWGGLEPGPDNYALMDGSVGHVNWFYAVGTFQLWNNGIPAYSDHSDYYAKQSVELYVRSEWLSQSPSSYPSFYPTTSPTISPTELPTPLPTSSPTNNPTQGPSLIPSLKPSESPTEFPTPLPTSTNGKDTDQQIMINPIILYVLLCLILVLVIILCCLCLYILYESSAEEEQWQTKGMPEEESGRVSYSADGLYIHYESSEEQSKGMPEEESGRPTQTVT